MALISSESITLIVNGTLQSEFLTMFWPMRFTYSVITESLMNLVLFSISAAYWRPILISESVEYQFPMPRPPISRFPTALTSSMLPGLTFSNWLPGSTSTGVGLAAAVLASFAFLSSAFLSSLDAPLGAPHGFFPVSGSSTHALLSTVASAELLSAEVWSPAEAAGCFGSAVPACPACGALAGAAPGCEVPAAAGLDCAGLDCGGLDCA